LDTPTPGEPIRFSLWFYLFTLTMAILIVKQRRVNPVQRDIESKTDAARRGQRPYVGYVVPLRRDQRATAGDQQPAWWPYRGPPWMPWSIGTSVAGTGEPSVVPMTGAVLVLREPWSTLPGSGDMLDGTGADPEFNPCDTFG
jgi:hypothetical protein